MRPIDNLSDDILLLIFGHSSSTSLRDALWVSHVCSRWRTLVTNHCPRLWTRFAFPDGVSNGSQSLKQKQEEILRRCHNLPLDVGWESWDHWHSGHIRRASQLITVLEHTHRFGSYAVAPPLERENASRVLNALGRTAHAPNLTELRASGLTRARGWYWLKLPRTMFGGNLSSLRELVLLGCWLDFSTLSIGSHLTTFEVGICSQSARARHENAGIPTTFREWIDVLRVCGNLQSFCLNQRYGEASSLPPKDLPQHLTLHHLTTASLTFEYEDLKTFLNFVPLPACDTLLLKIHGVELNAALRDRVEQLVDRYAQPSTSNPNLLDFFRIGRSSFGCGFWRNANAMQSVTLPAPYSPPPSRANLLIWLDVNAGWDFSSVTADPQSAELCTFLSGWRSVFDWVSGLAVSWPPLDLGICAAAVEAIMPELTALCAIVCPESGVGKSVWGVPPSMEISFVQYAPRSNVLSERIVYSPRDATFQFAHSMEADADAAWVASLSLHGPRL